MKVKGAECWGFLLFIIDLFERFSARLGVDGARLLEAGRALERFRRLLRTSPMNLPPVVVQELGGGF